MAGIFSIASRDKAFRAAKRKAEAAKKKAAALYKKAVKKAAKKHRGISGTKKKKGSKKRFKYVKVKRYY